MQFAVPLPRGRPQHDLRLQQAPLAAGSAHARAIILATGDALSLVSRLGGRDLVPDAGARRLRRRLGPILQLAAPQAAAGPGGAGGAWQYTNPVIKGDWSDPGVVRVGEDYYSVRSTFGWQPGLAVAHSKDLVHWEYIGNGFSSLPSIATGEVADGIWGSEMIFNPNTSMFMIYATYNGLSVFESATPEGPYTSRSRRTRGGRLRSRRLRRRRRARVPGQQLGQDRRAQRGRKDGHQSQRVVLRGMERGTGAVQARALLLRDLVQQRHRERRQRNRQLRALDEPGGSLGNPIRPTRSCRT